MYTYDDLAELARICARNSYTAHSREVAAALWKVAAEYQERAGKLKGGQLPDIGKPPPWLAE